MMKLVRRVHGVRGKKVDEKMQKEKVVMAVGQRKVVKRLRRGEMTARSMGLSRSWVLVC